MAILPDSPFVDVPIAIQDSQYVGWLNWCFPISGIVRVTGVWAGAIASIYAYGFVLRSLRVIQG